MKPTYLREFRNHSVGIHQSFKCEKFLRSKRNKIQAAKCGLGLNKNYLVDCQDFDIKLETNPIGMIQINNQKKLDFSKTEIDLDVNQANNRIFVSI